MPIVVEHYVVVGDRQEAERSVPQWRFLINATSYTNDPDPRSIQRRAEQDVSLEQASGSWVVSADPRVHIQSLQQLIGSGVTHIFVHAVQADQAKVVRFYGEQVLPELSQVQRTGSRR